MDDMYFSFLFAFFLRRMFLCVDFAYIYIIVASLLNGMCGFLCDFYDVRPGISCLS